MSQAAIHAPGVSDNDTETRLPSVGGPLAFALVAFALLLTFGGYVLGSGRSGTAPVEDSADAGFARDMMVHHAQAVEMAEIVRRRTEDPEIRTLATDIALTQQAQIGRVQGWLDAWGLPTTGMADPMTWMGHPMDDASMMPGMATDEEVAELAALPVDRMDVRFLQLMIPHHQAAILMADTVIELTDEREVRTLASSIASSQQAEIAAMRDLLAERGAQEIDPPVATPSPATRQSPSHNGNHPS